jgi:hypothetical protein
MHMRDPIDGWRVHEAGSWLCLNFCLARRSVIIIGDVGKIVNPYYDTPNNNSNEASAIFIFQPKSESKNILVQSSPL